MATLVPTERFRAVEIDEESDEHSLLVCPLCKYTNLHQERVEVFVRLQEDSDNGTHAVIDVNKSIRAGGRATVHLDTDADTRNPSRRRDGLKIFFSCEMCEVDDVIVLCIVQHKGQTFLQWDMKENKHG